MATSRERLAIIENVIARVGLDGDVLGEYSKAMSALNGLQTFSEMNPPIPQNLPPQGSETADSPSELSSEGQSTPTGGITA